MYSSARLLDCFSRASYCDTAGAIFVLKGSPFEVER